MGETEARREAVTCPRLEQSPALLSSSPLPAPSWPANRLRLYCGGLAASGTSAVPWPRGGSGTGGAKSCPLLQRVVCKPWDGFSGGRSPPGCGATSQKSLLLSSALARSSFCLPPASFLPQGTRRKRHPDHSETGLYFTSFSCRRGVGFSQTTGMATVSSAPCTHTQAETDAHMDAGLSHLPRWGTRTHAHRAGLRPSSRGQHTHTQTHTQTHMQGLASRAGTHTHTQNRAHTPTHDPPQPCCWFSHVHNAPASPW